MSFDKYKSYLKHAKVIATVDEEISKFIEYYVFKKMEHLAENLNNEDKRKLLEKIEKLGIFKHKTNVTKEQYVSFLIKLFKGIDDEERTGARNSELCAGFRLVVDLIELIFYWETIPYEWNVISKYTF